MKGKSYDRSYYLYDITFAFDYCNCFHFKVIPIKGFHLKIEPTKRVPVGTQIQPD